MTRKAVKKAAATTKKTAAKKAAVSVKKKIVAKKKVAKRSASPRFRTPAQAQAPTPVPVSPYPTQDVFTTQTPTPSALAVEPGTIRLFVKQTDRGTFSTEGRKLAEFVREQASNAGIRTFSVYVDDRKADTSISEAPLSNFSKIEIVAKDSRG